MEETRAQLRNVFSEEKLLAVYHRKFADAKGTAISGTVGRSQFLPNPQYQQAFYDLVFHDVLIPMSRLPLESLLAVDFTDRLPQPGAPTYPEQCLGLVTALDQTRILTSGYSYRYTRGFFDPLAEKLARQLVALPEDVRPDGKQAWLSRGYSFEQWLTRVLWFWAPLVHSDDFMVHDRQRLKGFLHFMRAEVEGYADVTDPFAAFEAADDVDIHLFPKMATEGPPLGGSPDSETDLAISDFAFWWIRILNAHFALTDLCGHYPYNIQWKGRDLSDKDREYLAKTNGALYDRSNEPVFEQVKGDVRAGVWRPLQPNPKFDRTGKPGP